MAVVYETLKTFTLKSSDFSAGRFYFAVLYTAIIKMVEF
jgi:hypothetical protein